MVPLELRLDAERRALEEIEKDAMGEWYKIMYLM